MVVPDGGVVGHHPPAIIAGNDANLGMLDHCIEQRILPAQVARSNPLALRFDHLDHQIGLCCSCAQLHGNPTAITVPNASPLRAVQQRIDSYPIIRVKHRGQRRAVRHRHVDLPAEGATGAEQRAGAVDCEQQISLTLRDPPPPGGIHLGNNRLGCCRRRQSLRHGKPTRFVKMRNHNQPIAPSSTKTMMPPTPFTPTPLPAYGPLADNPPAER